MHKSLTNWINGELSHLELDYPWIKWLLKFLDQMIFKVSLPPVGHSKHMCNRLLNEDLKNSTKKSFEQLKHY